MLNSKVAFPAVSLLTASILVLELALTRLFSATLHYHFAFMAISLALFGSGAGGVFVYLADERLSLSRGPRGMTLGCLLFALGVCGALGVILALPMAPFEVGWSRLALIYSATAVPFFFGGCGVTLAIMAFKAEPGRLYLFDLAGAAAGCLLLIPALSSLGAVNTILLTAAVGALAAVLFGLAAPSPRSLRAACVVTAGALFAALAWNAGTDHIRVRASKGMEETEVLFSKWNSFSRVTVVGDLASRRLQLRIDSDAATDITKLAGFANRHASQRNRIEALVYHLKQDGHVLIIGPGGGDDVMMARLFGQRRITAVEVNPIIARDVMSREPFLSYAGAIFQQPGVELVVDEGRSFIRRSADRYDVIQGTMVDTWAATAAGAFTLTENHLYTVEAFRDYTEHLADDGILSMTRWYFQPPDQLLRLVSITRAMMREMGMGEAERRLMLVRDTAESYERAPATFLFKRSPFTDEEVRRVEAVARESGFEILYTPLTRPANTFTRLIEAAEPASVWASLETNIAPTRDNDPFFFNSVRLRNVTKVVAGTGEWRKTNLGTFNLFALLFISAGLVVACILVPLAVARGRALSESRSSFASIAYFAFLGAGFLLIEVGLVQKFILLLGHPVYSLAVIIFSLLTFSAIGSYLTTRFREPVGRRIQTALVILIAAVVVYVLALSPLLGSAVQLPRSLRILLAVALIAPLGLVMGMPMPTGIRLLAGRAPSLIPWAWGVNGATSVLGSVGALVIALFAGFNAVLLAGALSYAFALACVGRLASSRSG